MNEERILNQIVHKIPGNSVIPNKEKQGYVELDKKSKAELLELIERQNKLLSKKSFINTLPDKGAKIIDFKIQLEEELSKRKDSDDLTRMMSRLNMGKEALDKLEWIGKFNPGQIDDSTNSKTGEDSEEEVVDPLKIIATHSGTVSHKKIHKTIKPLETLIKPSDISNETEDDIYDPYAKNLCEKFDKGDDECKTDKKEKFLPHRSVKPREKKDFTVKRKPNWEVTAATPPPPVYNDTKLISLHDSLKLQVYQAQKLKEIQMKHATEKLKSMSSKIGGTWDLNSEKRNLYRNPGTHYESSDDEDTDNENENFHSCNEEEEDEDEKRGGVVFYNLIDN